MTRVVIDTSALAAVLFEEPDAANIADRLLGSTVFAPTLLRYELANVAWKKARRHPALTPKIAKALGAVLDGEWNISWEDVDLVDALLIGRSIDLSPYDAAFLWLAGTLEAELVTLDHRLVKASEALAEEYGVRS